MPVPLLELFKYVFIAIVWLFFLRVLRAIWVEVKTSETAKKVASGSVSDWTASHRTAVSIGASERSKVTSQVVLGGVGDFRLLALEGPFQGREFRLKEETVIGRSEGCDIALADDNFASSKHAKIERRDDGFWITDLGSTNGTVVNSLRVSVPIQLMKGDLVKIGKSLFEVVQP